MRLAGKIMGWIGFSQVILNILVEILLLPFIEIYYSDDTMFSIHLMVTIVVIFIYLICPALWIANLFVSSRKAKRVLYILFTVSISLLSIIGLIGGILLIIATSKEIVVEKYKQLNKIYPWEDPKNTEIYPEYIYETFGFLTDGFGKYQEKVIEVSNKDVLK